ncbi:MAG: phosphatidate cytidylyltransferase [Pseudomonadales bacterium]|nr:phosphatidate cytidylyltransferase [Pseudomonadales bacterium]
MLKQRIITALILAPIALGGIFLLSPLYFSWFIGGVIVIAAWEWANLSNVTNQAARCSYALVMAGLLLGCQFLSPALVLTLSLLWWCAAFYLVKTYPKNTIFWAKPLVRLIIGVLVLVPAWKGLVFIRTSDVMLMDRAGAPVDVNSLLVIFYVMIVVWGADIGAYFAGRAFGNKKLAPSVSPGKSWAGVYGGLIVVGLLAIVVGLILHLDSKDTLLLLLVTLVTGIVSVLGDLLESMVKRFRGIKDSSQLLPGHGGFMDRVDSLTAAVPVFAFVCLMLGWLGKSVAL